MTKAVSNRKNTIWVKSYALWKESGKLINVTVFKQQFAIRVIAFILIFIILHVSLFLRAIMTLE